MEAWTCPAAPARQVSPETQRLVPPFNAGFQVAARHPWGHSSGLHPDFWHDFWWNAAPPLSVLVGALTLEVGWDARWPGARWRRAASPIRFVPAASASWRRTVCRPTVPVWTLIRTETGYLVSFLLYCAAPCYSWPRVLPSHGHSIGWGARRISHGAAALFALTSPTPCSPPGAALCCLATCTWNTAR